MIRRLAATLVALAVLVVPSVAAAQVGYDGCAPGGCTGPADEIRCWVLQRPDIIPDGHADRWRIRPGTGRWEYAVGTDTHGAATAGCVEVIPGLWVAPNDVDGTVRYLKDQALASGRAVELEGELVPNSLAMGWILCIHAQEASGWHNHRDGGMQIIPSTWRAYGGLEWAPVAGEAPIEQQIVVAFRVLDGGGVTQWPNTWRRCA